MAHLKSEPFVIPKHNLMEAIAEVTLIVMYMTCLLLRDVDEDAWTSEWVSKEGYGKPSNASHVSREGYYNANHVSREDTTTADVFPILHAKFIICLRISLTASHLHRVLDMYT